MASIVSAAGPACSRICCEQRQAAKTIIGVANVASKILAALRATSGTSSSKAPAMACNISEEGSLSLADQRVRSVHLAIDTHRVHPIVTPVCGRMFPVK